ncbi:unnamed protein product [Moneuplotes crassus]|uniref:Uncharacterized protein n=1 Tax=Euplotes crassus TaxID=5936 RepID=A0AAD2DA43_EUPCR|nr:unnamed protein product [Moneuplotes crassus]
MSSISSLLIGTYIASEKIKEGFKKIERTERKQEEGAKKQKDLYYHKIMKNNNREKEIRLKQRLEEKNRFMALTKTISRKEVMESAKQDGFHQRDEKTGLVMRDFNERLPKQNKRLRRLNLKKEFTEKHGDTLMSKQKSLQKKEKEPKVVLSANIFTIEEGKSSLKCDFFDMSDEERKNYRKVMEMICRKDGKGKILVADLVRDNEGWETNEKCMKSLFNLIGNKHHKEKKKPLSTFGTKRSFDHSQKIQKEAPESAAKSCKCQRERKKGKSSSFLPQRKILGSDNRNEREFTEGLKREYRINVNRRKKRMEKHQPIRNYSAPKDLLTTDAVGSFGSPKHHNGINLEKKTTTKKVKFSGECYVSPRNISSNQKLKKHMMFLKKYSEAGHKVILDEKLQKFIKEEEELRKYTEIQISKIRNNKKPRPRDIITPEEHHRDCRNRSFAKSEDKKSHRERDIEEVLRLQNKSFSKLDQSYSEFLNPRKLNLRPISSSKTSEHGYESSNIGEFLQSKREGLESIIDEKDKENNSYNSHQDYMGDTGVTFSHKQLRPRAQKSHMLLLSKRSSTRQRMNSACGSSRFFNRHREKMAKKAFQRSQNNLKKPTNRLQIGSSVDHIRKKSDGYSSFKNHAGRKKLTGTVSQNFKSFIQECEIPITYGGDDETPDYMRSPVTIEPTSYLGSRVDYNTNAIMTRIVKKECGTQITNKIQV